MTKRKNIVVFRLGLLFWNFGQKMLFFLKFWEKIAIFQKFCCQFQNLRLGVCLAKSLKFPEFEAGCAYELFAYKKKRAIHPASPPSGLLPYLHRRFTQLRIIIGRAGLPMTIYCLWAPTEGYTVDTLPPSLLSRACISSVSWAQAF